MNAQTRFAIAILAALCLVFPSPLRAATAAKTDKAGKTTKAATASKPTTTAKPATASKPTTTAKPAAESKETQFRLKPGAQQKVCLTCHPGFEDLLKKPFVHTPIKKTGCTACHNPHTSNYSKQLAAKVSELCLMCHKEIMPAGARSTHKVALEGKCVKCHDPHAADNKFNLRTAGNDLCFSCHKEKADTIVKVKFKHDPVTKGCVNCHNPHASMKAAALLKSEAPELCKECHQVDKPLFLKQHLNYPVGGSQCTKCHDVHGSNRAGMIYNTAHPPFANKTCNLCHDNSTAPNPLALKKKGFELCRGCHNNMVNEMFSKNRIHWPVLGKDGCLNCHSPHATTQASLLKNTPIRLCGQCHIDTIQRQERSITKHEPMQDGVCTVCHSPHATDNVLLFTTSSTIEVCGLCHDYSKHSSHPIGEKVIDKRNKNLMVACLSCHRAHGTEYKHMLPVPTVSELCTQCHIEYSR